MKRAAAVALIAALLSPAAAARAHLVFRRRIGVEWKNPSGQWMSYVAFSPDGAMVASDGPAPDGQTHGITLWKFADGAFVRAIEGKAVGALSDDWSIAVADGALLDARDGKPL